MTRQDFVLAVMAAGNGDIHTSVQVQKLFFLLDRKVPQEVGGPYFEFVPHAYGPYDKNVYIELRSLAEKGFASKGLRQTIGEVYHLTPKGRSEGDAMLETLEPRMADYIRELSAWVRRQELEQLVTAVYEAFPEMRVGGVFQE